MDFRIGYRRPLRTATLLRKKRQRTRLWLGVVIAAAVTVTACTWEPGESGAASTAAAAPTLHVALDSKVPPAARAARRIYPYSIVPGGVGSRADIAHRVATDPVVARHYAAFDVTKAHAVTVRKPRAVHVSYRKGDKIYWTARKVMLAEGETLLSDGTHDIRGRCGNRISDTAMLPVAMNEPSAAELDESMNVAAEPADDGSLQNASFGLDDMMAGNPTAFQRFSSFNVPLDNVQAAPPARASMPSAPAGPRSAMGLEPARYLSVSASPAMVLDRASQAPATVAPATPAAAVPMPAPAGAAAAPDTPAAPVFVATPIEALTPVAALPVALPLAPVAADIPALVNGPAAPAAPQPALTDPKTPIKAPLPAGEIPEPGTLWLVGAALALLLLVRRRPR